MSSIKILVADDSAADRFIIKSMLSEYSVLTARNGLETIRILEEHDGINLLILDLNMPKMNGFEVLEYLKKNDRYRNLRTVILTIYDELDNEIKVLKLGAIDYIRKPIQMDSLKARIDVHAALLRAEEALRKQLDEQTMTFDMLFEQAPIGITISYNSDPENVESSRARINSVYEQLTGRTREELISLGWAKITHPEDLARDLENFRKLQKGEIKNYSLEKRFIKPDGTITWVYKTAAVLAPMGGSTNNHIFLIQDISERKQLEIERRYIAEHDRWTGLYNREYLATLLKKHMRSKKDSPKALKCINLSMVQLLTANYGYQYAQNLLKTAAEELSRYSTEKRILFYPCENRFVFYLFDYRDRRELIDFSGVIAETLESLFITDRISGGIGVLEFEQTENDDIDIDSLLTKLMIASDKAVSQFGKNYQVCFYNEEIETMVERERDIVEALDVIAADGSPAHELFLQYQPILDINTGFITGFEALARLRTAKLGLVHPQEFIPLAEKTKLIIPIGKKILVKAFCFLNRLREHGQDNIGISVNVSIIQLLSPNFAAMLMELIEEMQVKPDNVCIEITESVFASDFDSINNIIERLRNAGLRVGIDDFGTGYSSLARERELKVDCMKIDRFFIDKLMAEDLQKAITGDIISLAHKLGHYVVAEGVEHELQLQYLKRHHCDRIQGDLVSKPLDEEEALAFLSGRGQ